MGPPGRRRVEVLSICLGEPFEPGAVERTGVI